MLQMHVVHFDAERFADASAAQQHPGGLAVLGVLLEVRTPHPRSPPGSPSPSLTPPHSPRWEMTPTPPTTTS